MSTITKAPVIPPSLPPHVAGGESLLRSKLVNRSRFYLAMFLLVAPTMVGMLVFNYYPKFSGIKYAFYDWDGQFVEDFIGLKNFQDIFTRDSARFFGTFQLVGILLVTNLLKMWPSIFAAIVLHRIRSERWQYMYRVLFVVPMVIPGLVWLLIWKYFFDPTVGVLNRFLQVTGLIRVLQWADVAMPTLAHWLSPWRIYLVDHAFGSVWGLFLAGAVLLTMLVGVRSMLKAWVWWGILLLVGWGLWGPARGAATMLGIILVGEVLRRQSSGKALIKWLGGAMLAVASFFLLTTMIWTDPTKAFQTGQPAWLGHTQLVIPSIVFWGFPWIGTIGVLLYLAALQAIPQDVYEAAELDGVGSLGKAFYIELPLIMTMVRINLIFMTIGTLNDYGLFLLLLGADGGPDNRGLTPGLYMYSTAFTQGRFGYACALGMVLFVLILAITVIYQKYVKIDK